jgi:hypothetical protein
VSPSLGGETGEEVLELLALQVLSLLQLLDVRLVLLNLRFCSSNFCRYEEAS